MYIRENDTTEALTDTHTGDQHVSSQFLARTSSGIAVIEIPHGDGDADVQIASFLILIFLSLIRFVIVIVIAIRGARSGRRAYTMSQDYRMDVESIPAPFSSTIKLSGRTKSSPERIVRPRPDPLPRAIFRLPRPLPLPLAGAPLLFFPFAGLPMIYFVSRISRKLGHSNVLLSSTFFASSPHDRTFFICPSSTRLLWSRCLPAITIPHATHTHTPPFPALYCPTCHSRPPHEPALGTVLCFISHTRWPGFAPCRRVDDQDKDDSENTGVCSARRKVSGDMCGRILRCGGSEI